MIPVRHPLDSFDPTRPAVAVVVDRLKLQKRRWRATAADQTDFGIEVEHPLTHGQVIHQTGTHRYVIAQAPEPVLEIDLPVGAAAVARLAWSIGNLHFPLQVLADRLRVADDPALRQLFAQLGLDVVPTTAVFEPVAAGSGHHHHEHHQPHHEDH